MKAKDPPRIRVIHLSSVHRPFDNRIFVKQCRSLVDQGDFVTFIVPYERDEIRDGVSIRKTPYPRNRLERVFFTTLRVLILALREAGDVYQFHDPELLLVGLILRLSGKKVIYDVHENYPKVALNRHYLPIWIRPLLGSVLGLMERLSAKFLSGVVIANPEESDRFGKVPITLVQNFPTQDDLSVSGGLPYLERRNTIVYVGGVARARAGVEMVRAMEYLPAYLNAELIMIGKFESEEFEEQLRKLEGWKKVRFLGVQGREGIREAFLESRIGLSLLHPIPQYMTNQSTKLFEYMGAALPIVGSNFGFTQVVITNSCCGRLVNPKDPKNIASEIQWLLENPEKAKEMGQRGNLEAMEKYSWESEFKSLDQLYRRICL